MRNFYKNIVLFIVLMQCSPFGGWGAYAQLYPVNLTPIFNVPYSVKISEYANSMDTKMQLLINPTDFAITQKQVRLKLYIQGNRLNIQSSDYIQGQRPIFINGGELQTLTNTDIAALFRLENLQGITAAQYAAPLPDGMYNFCFEMYDFLTNEKLSQKSCGMMYLQLNDPPILNIPAKNEQIVATDFPNILFNWTPRQINATNVSYKFELKQIIDPAIDPQIGFMMAPLLHEETVFSTALLYNLSMPILTPGMRYAWRVKAISTTGLSENAVFKNDGYSEIFSFKYATNCSAPNFLLSQAQSAKSAKITWQSQSGNRKFHVQYRTKGVAKAEWFSVYTQNDQVTLTNLEPELSYEFRVGATCEAEQYGIDPSYVYSNIQEFRMPEKSNAVQAYNCGIRPALKISNQTPLTNLIQSETFTAGDFPVTILELSGKSPYSGLGYVVVPYLADTKIAVEFNNIIINTDYQLINGIVETSYNPDWNNVANIKEPFDDLLKAVSDLISKQEQLLADNSDGIKNQEEFENIWIEYEKESKEKFDLLFNSGDLPQSIKDDITKVAGNTFTASTENNAPKVTEFSSKKEELKAQKELIEAISQTNKTFDELVSFLDLETVLKCKKCDEAKKVSTVQIDKIGSSSFSFNPYNKERYICILGSIIKGEFKLKKIDAKQANASDKKLLESTKKAFNTNKSIFLAVVHTDNQLVECNVKYASDEICSADKKVSAKTEKEIAEEISACYDDNKANFILPALATAARKNQSVEFFYNNEVYRFINNQVEKVENPLSDEQINNGNWTEDSDVKIRYEISNNGVIQYKALGFWKQLSIANGKTADLKKLSKEIKEKANTFFQKYKVVKADLTPIKAGVDLNKDSEEFADGEKIALDNKASFYKISSELIGLTTTFLKSAEIEEPTYLASSKPITVVHAPGLVTGTIESGATVVTDITSLCSMIYDLSTDEKARTEMHAGLVKLKDVVKDEPAGIIPIFAQMLSGNTNDEWAAIAKDQTDEGKKGHLYSRGVVTSVKSAIVGGALITKLPELSEKLVENIKKVKNAVELVGKYDWGTAKRYFAHIQDITGRQVLQVQVDKLKEALRAKEYKKLSPAEVTKHRKKFTSKVKNKCIEDWERETGQKWPRYTEEVLDKNGDVVRAIGTPYDAHHIIENQFEGPHEWWNMHPAKFPDEHQGGIHGAGSPSRELFK
ncbi:fibronectin type III domain-containing protein [Flavobacterium hercynium]|uniref:fibronectin type III domain-containing protein n=1 Tax=Flavobacterium hercynium TaxID=387094 RepID=UPI000F508F19|nr:fibronectin type III domain-containing protein [Flavobacterium hercynium]SMP36614.1 Fibronectin type III domain-containing protein [Flavobacterium hercynium]